MVAEIGATHTKKARLREAGQSISWAVALCFLVSFFSPDVCPALEKNEEKFRPVDQLPIPRTISARPGSLQLLPDSEYYTTLTTLIQGASQSIDMAMFLFKAPKNSRPAHIAEELIKAQGRGVRVRILLENSGYDEKINEANKAVAALLEKNRITVRFDSPERTAHTKMVVIDKRYCLVGSHNLTQSALKYNNELSLLIDSRPLARELLDYMEKIGLSAED